MHSAIGNDFNDEDVFVFSQCPNSKYGSVIIERDAYDEQYTHPNSQSLKTGMTGNLVVINISWMERNHSESIAIDPSASLDLHFQNFRIG